MEHKTDKTEDFHEEITLERLENLDDYKVADGYKNVVDWKVVADKELNIGKVRGLVASKELGRVLYLDILVEKSLCSDDESKLYILVPIGLAKFNTDDKTVSINSIDADTFVSYPRYDGSDIRLDYERLLYGYYSKHPNIELKPYIGRQKADYDNEMLYDKKIMHGSPLMGI
ncbi:hypothetical protein WAF17_20290 [Bernardetia sp. ABR2-2B]|uniref:hypothetical protein n=1 Tax=Bernardetia sp. ABR2-2B TaxID=3127472 RepID=UPI0030D05150